MNSHPQYPEQCEHWLESKKEMKKISLAISITFVFSFLVFSYYFSTRLSNRTNTDLINKLESMSRKNVLIDTELFPSSNVLDLQNINPRRFRDFFDAYLEIHNLLIINRGENLHIVELKELERIWMRDLRAALAESKAQNKPLLIKLTLVGCRPCELQDLMFYREEKIFNELTLTPKNPPTKK